MKIKIIETIEKTITTIIVLIILDVLFCPLNPCNVPRLLQKSIDNLKKDINRPYKLADKNYPIIR